MIRFFSITSFRDRIAALLSIKRGVYAGVKKEIAREFLGKSIDEIRQNRDMIIMLDTTTISKLRLPDKKMRLSKKDGYRLIYMVSREEEIVTFLDIYPKNGPSQQLDIKSATLMALIMEFIDEFDNNQVQEENLSLY